MIYTYGFSLTGISHLDKGTECQDAHKIKALNNGWVIAAVADGVGSAVNSAIGAQVAVDTVVSFCEECMPCDYNIINIKSMLRTAFNYALKRITVIAAEQENEIESYDTTLTVVIYDGSKMIYGHSGDGGIVGLTAEGDYIMITKQQKSEDNISVIPLRAGFTSWEIASCEEDLTSVLLLTDGMLEMLQPYLLKRLQPPLYVPTGMFLMDYNCFEYGEDKRALIDPVIQNYLEGKLRQEDFYCHLHKALMNYRSSEEEAVQILNSIKAFDYPMKLIASVKDDKTVVGLINCDRLPEVKPADYYLEPDWPKLQEEWNRAAYPSHYLEIRLGTKNKPRESSCPSKANPPSPDEVIRAELIGENKCVQCQEINKDNPFMGIYYGTTGRSSKSIIDLPLKQLTDNMLRIMQQIKSSS